MNVINRSRKQGMSLLPVLALSAVLSALLLVATNYKATASQEDLTQRKMAATSAINMAAVDLRTEGRLPAERTVNVDGVNVLVRSTLGPDGNTMKISADGQGEVVQATAIREAAQTPASNAGAAPQVNTNVAYASNAPLGGAVGNSGGAYGGGGSDHAGAIGQAQAGAAPQQTIGTPGGWVVFNADNVIISKDSANRGPILEAVAAKAEAARQASAAAEQARVDAINAENARVAAAQAQAQADAQAAAQAQAQAQAEAAAYASKMAVYRDATASAAPTLSATAEANVEALMQLMATWRGISKSAAGYSAGAVQGPGGVMMADGSRF